MNLNRHDFNIIFELFSRAAVGIRTCGFRIHAFGDHAAVGKDAFHRTPPRDGMAPDGRSGSNRDKSGLGRMSVPALCPPKAVQPPSARARTSVNAMSRSKRALSDI